MTRTRLLVAGAAVVATSLLGTGTPAVSATAVSAPVNSASVTESTGLSAPHAATTAAQVSAAGADQSAASADHSRAIQLSWDGSSYSDATTESFVGFPVTVPGDSTSRTIMVRNDGPTDGTLTVSIVDVELLTPTIDDDFYSDLLIDWQTGRSSIRDLESAGTTRIIEMPLPQGETTPVTIGYDFPREATSGNKSDVGERQGRFDVLFQLGGDDAGSAGAETDGSSDSSGQSDAGGQSDAAADSDAAANSNAGADANTGADANARAAAAGSANSDGSTAAAGGSGSTANADGSGSDASSDGGFLPRTGGAMWWMAVLGAVIAGAGAAMVRLVQRRSN